MARRGGPINKSSKGYKSGKASAASGIKQWVDQIEKALAQQTVSEATMQKAVDVLAEEAMRLTPIDSGDLRGAQYKYIRREGNSFVGVVGYDTSKAPHALVVHEKFANHRPGSWKYLEFALQNKSSEIIRILGGAK